MNIEFAPLNISIERRLQTLGIISVLFVQVGNLFAGPALAFYLIFYTRFWWLCLLYIIWYLTLDRETAEGPGRKSEWIRSWICWEYARRYFPVKLVKLPWGELDPKRNYLFCIFPHGILSTGASITFTTNVAGFPEAFPNHTPFIHTISLFYKLPFVRDFILSVGGLSASAKCLNYRLSRPEGGSISGLVVGGAEEAYYCEPGLNKIVYKRRKGFVKMALRHGSPLVPVYCFGETDLYSQMKFKKGSLFDKFRNVVQKLFGFSLVIPRGRGIFQYSFGLLPHRSPVTVVVGEPLDVEKVEQPTQEQIDELHQKFEKKIMELFESQKIHYVKNFENAHLEII